MKYITAIALIVAATPAMAQTQNDRNRQAATEAESADAELATEYRGAMDRMKRADRSSASGRPVAQSRERVLATGQGPWLTFRRSQCTIEGYDARGGPTETMLVDQCRACLTRARSGELRKALLRP